MIQDRTEEGKFAPKSEEPRHVRSIRLTDTTWEKIGFAADKRRITWADLVEQMAEDGVFDEVAAEQSSSGLSIVDMDLIVQSILSDPTVTRNGKDKSAIRRGLQALLNRLK